MIQWLVDPLRRALGRSASDQAVQPLLAGYRGSLPRGVKYLALVILAVACFGMGASFGLMAPIRMMPFAIPIALLMALVLWCLPAGDYAPTQLIEPLLMAYFVSIVMWPNYLAVVIGNLPWMTLLRVFGIGLTVTLLACVSISHSFRRKLKEITDADPVLFKLLVALIFLWTVTIPMSSNLGLTLNSYFISQMNGTAILFASCYAFSRPGFAMLWSRTLLVMLTVLCLFGLWEASIQTVPWANHIPPFLKVDDPSIKNVTLLGVKRGLYRVRGPSTTPLGFAELLGLFVPFAMYFAFTARQFLFRVGAMLFIPLAVGVILLTDSRLGVVAACGAVMIYLLIWAALRWRQNKTSLLAPAIVLAYPVIFTAFMASTFLVGRLRVEFWGGGGQQASTQGRLDQWAIGIPKILKNPIGHGIGEGANALGFRNLDGVLTIDSYWLSTLLELGIAGFIVFYGLILRAAFTAAKTVVIHGDRDEFGLLLPMSVSLINFVIVKMVFSQGANHPLIFMVLGGVFALAFRAQRAAAQTQSVGPVVAAPAIRVPRHRLRPQPIRS